LPNPFATPVGVKNLVLTESSVTGADGIYVPTVLVNFDPPTTTDSIYWHHGEIWTKTSDSGTTWAYYGNSIGGSTYTIDGIRAGFWGYTQGGVTVDVAVRSMHATVHAGFIAQDLESATSASENIDELPTGYFTVHPTIGKAMFSTVSNAIAALPANGGEIKLLEGTHRVGSGVSMPNKDVYIYGAGSGVTVRPSPGDPGFQIHNKTKRYRFSNFTIHSRNVFPAGYDYIIDVRGSGSCSANNTADLEIDNMRIILQDRGNPSFSPAGDYGIFAQYGSGSFSVRDTTVEGGAYGILLQYQNNIQIMGCHVKGTLDAGISVQVDTDSRCIVSNNFVSDYYTLGIAVGAGTPSGVTGAIIANNQIVLGTGAWSGAGATQGINVGGNKVHVGNNYIQMVNSEDVAGVGVVGIRVQYSKAGNLISNNKIVISMDTTVALNGITQAGVSNSIVSNNAVEVLNNDHTAESFGIKFTNCYANVVSNNNVLMSNDANDIGIDTDDGTCRYNYGVGNKTYLVGANDISANDSITIDDD
jgi:hypothetical protein